MKADQHMVGVGGNVIESDRDLLPYVTDDMGRAFICTKGTDDNPDNKLREDGKRIVKGELLARRYEDWQMLDETPQKMDETLAESIHRAAKNYKRRC